jgi:hypothetical protein
VRAFEWDRARTLSDAWLSPSGLSVGALPTQASWLTLRLELGGEGAATLLARVRAQGPLGTPFLEFVDVSPQLRSWLADVVARRQMSCVSVAV